MAFKRKSAATAVAEKPLAQKINLKAAIETLRNQLESAFTETAEIPDVALLDMPEFGQTGIDALAECAKKVGVENYDPANTSTFKFIVTKTGSKFLSGPQLKAYGDGCCVIWGDQAVEMPENQNFFSDDYQLMAGSKENKTTTLLLDPAGFCLPIECRIDSVYRQDDLFFSTKLVSARTADTLSHYLQRGEPIIKWNDIEDGPIALHSISPVTDGDGNVKFGLMLAEYKGKPIQVYSPGEYEEWGGISFDEPIEAVKEGRNIRAAGRTFELKGSFIKLRELPKGGVFKVLAYKPTQNTWEGKTIYDFQISAIDETENLVTIVGCNTFLKEKLGRNPVISEESPATLHIDEVNETKRGTRVSCRLMTAADNDNPFLKKLLATQAAKASTENYDKNPF